MVDYLSAEVLLQQAFMIRSNVSLVATCSSIAYALFVLCACYLVRSLFVHKTLQEIPMDDHTSPAKRSHYHTSIRFPLKTALPLLAFDTVRRSGPLASQDQIKRLFHSRRFVKMQAFGVDHPQAKASALRLLQVYDAQQGGRQEEAAELRANPKVRVVQPI